MRHKNNAKTHGDGLELAGRIAAKTGADLLGAGRLPVE